MVLADPPLRVRLTQQGFSDRALASHRLPGSAFGVPNLGWGRAVWAREVL